MWNFPPFWTHFGLSYIKIPKIFALCANFPFIYFLWIPSILPLKHCKNKGEIRILGFSCLGKNKDFWPEYLPLRVVQFTGMGVGGWVQRLEFAVLGKNLVWFSVHCPNFVRFLAIRITTVMPCSLLEKTMSRLSANIFCPRILKPMVFRLESTFLPTTHIQTYTNAHMPLASGLCKSFLWYR